MSVIRSVAGQVTEADGGDGGAAAAEALLRLQEGNARFVAHVRSEDTLARQLLRADLASGQKPFAVVLGCSDSRVPAELVFDQGLGDLFVIRVAGNIVAPSQIGSVEFAVERFGTAQLEARYLLRADDGAVIDILNRGYFRATPQQLARMEAGEDIPEDEPGLYFRTAPVFQTDAPQHRWLAENQFIGMARDDDGHVAVRVFLLQ